MSIVYGVTPNGYVAKPMDVVVTEIDNGLKTILGESAGTNPDGTIPLDTFAGQLKTLTADWVGAGWDGQQAIFSSYDPNTAVDESQDALCAQTGTLRQPAEFSQVNATMTGTPATVVPATPTASAATVATTGTRFDIQTSTTLNLLSNWIASTGYIVGDRVTNSSNCYQCITAGTSAGSGGPTTQADDITDNTVHWTWLGVGTAAGDSLFIAEISGALAAIARSLNTIATPVSGWSNIINLTDATIGRAIESNTALRVRREAELTAGQQATPNAIRAAVFAVGDESTDPTAVVTACTVFYNDSDLTVDGLPPHSVNVLALGGHDVDIANAIFATVAAGIQTVGAVTITVTDSQGNPQVVNFDRPTDIPIYVIANVVYNPLTFPSPDDLSVGKSLIAEAIYLSGSTYQAGFGVRSTALSAQVFDGPSSPGGSPVPGVLEVTSLFIGTAPSPASSATIPITNKQQATFSTVNITVNLTPGSPGG